MKKKNDLSNYSINLQKIILNRPITILSMFLAGEFSQKIEAVSFFFFPGFEGVFMGSDYGKSKCYVFGLWE
jgi:hypothetical protein